MNGYEKAGVTLATTFMPVPRVLKHQIPIDDVERTEHFVHFVDGHARYVTEWGQWLLWDGKHWVANAESAVLQKAIELTDELEYESEQIRGTTKERGAAYALVRKARSKGALDAMVYLAKSYPEVETHVADIDSDPYLFGVQNGVIDLRTGEFREAVPADMILKKSKASFDANAKCPQWEEFLQQILPQPDLIPFLQRALGYSLTALTIEQTLFFLYGTGANGKSTFIETVEKLMGDYSWRASASLFLQNKFEGDPATMLARLPEKRFVVGAEVDAGVHLAECRIKDLTGGDTLNARELYAKAFQFRPTHKLWFYGNHRPTIRGTDMGIWRRMCLIPFSVAIPEDKRDTSITQRLWKESSGILNWAINGCLSWQKMRLQPPEVVRVAVEDYREEEDTIGEFLVTECLKGEGKVVMRAELFRAYTLWCESRGVRHGFGVKSVADRVRSESGVEGTSRRIKGKVQKVWLGIEIADPASFPR